MADAGSLSGFVGVGMDMAIRQTLYHINITLRCNTELATLKDLVMSIQPILTQIQQYRLELNMKKGISTSHNSNTAAAVNEWLKKLDGALQQASEVVHQCTIPGRGVISRYQTSKKINRLISDIHKHLKLLPLIHLAQTQELLHGQLIEGLQDLGSSSATTSVQVPTAGFFIDEPLIVGQEEAYAKLEKFVMEADRKPLFRIGVVGKGGSGKTLLLKRVFNSQQVRDLFVDDLFLWLTVSRTPSYTTLRNELCSQIAMKTKVDLDLKASPNAIKIWLNQRLQRSRFALFLDDVWEEGSKLLEELALLHLTEHSSKVIVSSRNHRGLLEMGIAELSTIAMEDLPEDKSWQLFANHAFMYNNGHLPSNVDEKTAKLVCANCGGLPLAIKVVGRTMAGIAHPDEWELAARRLPNGHSRDHQSSLYDSLRLSYDALGSCFDVNLQLCFLYLGAFLEDQVVVITREVVQFWIGEGLLAKKKTLPDQLSYDDPFKIVRIYVNILADRCLIEPTMRDADGRVIGFRMHDVLRDLAIQIAEGEENCYFRAGRGLTALTEDECSGRTRISLTDNKLRSLPESLSVQGIRSLLMARNKNFNEFPRRLIRNMTSLKILDLSDTSIQCLPESVGCLKQLVCLRLVGLPIKKLPVSLTNLVRLEILDVENTNLSEVPADLHKLTSLRCLYLSGCPLLQSLPSKICSLTTLQYLSLDRCAGLWQRGGNKRYRKMASINNLCSLTRLRFLFIQNNGETVSVGTFGGMTQMEWMQLALTRMTSLPHDIINMSNLRRLHLECPHLVKMDFQFWQLQYLSHLTLFGCEMLEDLPDLHKIRNLKQLEIIRCPKIKKFPKEFGATGAFSRLDIFSLAWLDKLEELPAVEKEEDTMPSLQIFSILECEALKLLPENYLHLKKLKKVRIYGSSMVLENLKTMNRAHKTVEIVTIPSVETKELVEKYLQVRAQMQAWIYGEFWSHEFLLFLRSILPSKIPL